MPHGDHPAIPSQELKGRLEILQESLIQGGGVLAVSPDVDGQAGPSLLSEARRDPQHLLLTPSIAVNDRRPPAGGVWKK
jgi:hypothetical protein